MENDLIVLQDIQDQVVKHILEKLDQHQFCLRETNFKIKEVINFAQVARREKSK